ncbi:MAG: SUMF1/EgtB/PvdO family nonheme iron enzyme [Chloroflexota bacterium]
MIDWDLDAPGLDRFFFGEEIKEAHPGLIDMLLDYKNKITKKWSKDEPLPLTPITDYIINIPTTHNQYAGSLKLIYAGDRSNKEQFARRVLSFDWNDFYLNWGGEIYFEWFRQQCQAIADVVLIDSRTGVTEMGGVCTYQLADTIVALCAANYQNLSGTTEMAQKFLSNKVLELREERPLNVFVVPARIDDRAEVDQLEEFAEDFAKELKNLNIDTPFSISPDDMWKIRIPHVPHYAFREKIVIREANPKRDIDGMYQAYLRLLILLSRFKREQLYPKIENYVINILKKDFVISEINRIKIGQENVSLSDTKKHNFFTGTMEPSYVRSFLKNIAEPLQTGTISVGDISDSQAVAIGSTIRETIRHNYPQIEPEKFRRAYLGHIFAQTHNLALEGIAPMNLSENILSRSLSLHRIYTPLLTTSDAMGGEYNRKQIATMSIAKHLIYKPRPLSAFEQLNNHPRLVLQGDLGSGKSTFTNFVTLCLAGAALNHDEINLNLLTLPVSSNNSAPYGASVHRKKEPLSQWDHGQLLPVRVILRDFVVRGLTQEHGQDASMVGQLWSFIEAELTSVGLRAYVNDLQAEFREKGGLIIFDGLDEVPEAEQRREQVKQVIDEFANAYPECRILVTSRPYAYQQPQWKLANFEETMLAPFTQNQIEFFIDKWYMHNADRKHLNYTDTQGKANHLKQKIKNTRQLRDFAETPLLLTLLVSLHAWKGGNLPKTHSELYEKSVELLLDQWEQRRVAYNLHGELEYQEPSLTEYLKVDREQIVNVLGYLAYKVHLDQENLTDAADIHARDLVYELYNLNPDDDLTATVDPKKLVFYLSNRAGILLPKGAGVYAFPHRTFQEYMAAIYLTKDEYPLKLARLARKDPDRWREVISLAASRAGQGTPYALWALIERLSRRRVTSQKWSNEDDWGTFFAGRLLVQNDLIPTNNAVDRQDDLIPTHNAVDRQDDLELDDDEDDESDDEKLAIYRDRLVYIMTKPKPILPPIERAEVGNVVSALGDSRDLDEWIHIAAGSFWMGSHESEDASYYEKPQHQQVIEKAYWIGKYPVTNQQYERFVSEQGYPALGHWEGQHVPMQLCNHPVVNVSWTDAYAYCQWLSEKLGRRVHLPSEAQWERAARGQTKNIYPWGDQFDTIFCNVNDTGIGTTSAVGIFTDGASPDGCMDMAGNVWEWTRSLWGRNIGEPEYKYPYQLGDEMKSSDLYTTSNSRKRWIIRGGSWSSIQGKVDARCARRWSQTDRKIDELGFRVVMEVE